MDESDVIMYECERGILRDYECNCEKVAVCVLCIERAIEYIGKLLGELEELKDEL